MVIGEVNDFYSDVDIVIVVSSFKYSVYNFNLSDYGRFQRKCCSEFILCNCIINITDSLELNEVIGV